jgi:hypothetical protein
VLLIGPALGVVFGVVALRQLGQSQLDRSPSGGRGLAIAGITIGIILFVLDVIGLIAVATDGGSSGPGGLSTLHALSAAVRLAIA